MNRTDYIVKTFDSAAHLLASCSNIETTQAILSRVADMAGGAWLVEFPNYHDHKLAASKSFWNQVCQKLLESTETAITAIEATCNPKTTGKLGAVWVRFQVVNRAQWFKVRIESPLTVWAGYFGNP